MTPGKLTGIRPYLFHFLSTPSCLLSGVCVQMGISISHSSSPNWHLTAAPHGLLASSVSIRIFPGVGRSSAASDITQLRGHFLPHSLLPPLPPFIIPFPRSYLVPGRSLHPRQPRALIIASLSHPVAPQSTPLPLCYSSPISTSTFSLFSPSPTTTTTTWRKHREDVVHPGPDTWPHFQNLIFI